MDRQAGGVGLRAFLFDVHCGAECKTIQQSKWNMKAALRVSEGQQNRIVRRKARLRGVERIDPRIKLLAAVTRGKRRIVSDIVAAPHECIDGAKRLSFDLRENQKPV